MTWFQAVLLGLVQGLTEFLPVSSSGHLMIFRDIIGADPEGFLDFTVAVHFATVLSTIVVFRKQIGKILCGLFRFRYNDETDYVLKIAVSMLPVAVVGLFLKDRVEALFGEKLQVVAAGLLVTALLLFLSDRSGKGRAASAAAGDRHRNGISFLQALVTGFGQALAVAPGLSRSGTTIASGLLCGVKREVMAQFSFLMVLVPIVGEQLLSFLDTPGADAAVSSGVGFVPMACGALAAFLSGLFACSTMVALVRKARLSWFSLYCLAVAAVILIFG